MMKKSFITNLAFPKSLDELLYFIEDRGKFDVQEVLEGDYLEWTAPQDASIGDIAFFMFSKSSIDTIRRLRKELKLNRNEIEDFDCDVLFAALNEGEKLYREIGGAIFARGVVCGDIIIDDVAIREGLHWSSRCYAPIDSITLIKPPIHINEFRDFITISRTGAITKLNSEQAEMLAALR